MIIGSCLDVIFVKDEIFYYTCHPDPENRAVICFYFICFVRSIFCYQYFNFNRLYFSVECKLLASC